MAETGPFVAKGLLVARISRLTPAGAPRCSFTDGSAWDPCLITLDATARTAAGTTTELRCGDGVLADQEVTPDQVTGVDITLEVARHNKGFIIVATGAQKISNVGGVIFGYMAAKPSDSPDPVELGLWVRNRSGSGAAASPNQYLRLVFPQVKFSLGDLNTGAEYFTTKLNGPAEVNNSIKGGTFDDLPAIFDGRFYGTFDDQSIPTPGASPYSAVPNGGLFATPACAS